MRLLLVEDERKLSQVLAKGLKKLSYTVDQAFDGEEALELFSVYGYDLVVLDLNLPKIDGWEVLRQIRQQDRQVKVLILSAKNQVEDKIAGLDLGEAFIPPSRNFAVPLLPSDFNGARPFLIKPSRNICVDPILPEAK